MWIDRLEFIGFGNLTGQRIDLAKNKLSVVIQSNEYGKSTISEAIWAVIYDYAAACDTVEGQMHEVSRKPLSGAAFKACMDVAVDGRQMRLIRDFADRSLKVLDLSKDPSKADSDITQEFAGLLAQGRLGEHLVSLNRELFKSVCLFSRENTKKLPFAGDRALAGLLLDTAEAGDATGNIFEAIGTLEEKLELFPFRGKVQSLDELIAQLESERHHLADDLRKLEAERLNCDRDVEQLAAVEERLQLRSKIASADEYFQYCQELAEVDERLARIQERAEKIKDLEIKLADVESYSHFGGAAALAINEMWMRRQSRLSDLSRLQAEVEEKVLRHQIEDLTSRMLGEGLEDLSADDGHMLSALSRGLGEVEQEIADTSRKLKDESARVRAQGVRVDLLADVRKSLLSLHPKELDDLHSTHAKLAATREQSNDCIISAEKATRTINEILGIRDLLIRTCLMIFWPLVALACLFLAAMLDFLYVMHVPSDDMRIAVSIVLWFLACAGATISFYVCNRIRRGYRDKEEIEARSDEQMYRAKAQELSGQLSGYEARINELAIKANLESGEQLVKNMQDYALSASQLKELDLLEYLLRNQKSRAAKLQQQIKPYFVQAKRDPETINFNSASALAQDISRFLDAKRQEAKVDRGEHRVSEIRFLKDELKDDDRLIIQELAKLGINAPTLEQAYAKFLDCQHNYRRWEMLDIELARLTDDTSGELSSAGFIKITDRLEAKRTAICIRMQELVANNPDIANMSPSTEELVRNEDMSDIKLSVEKLKHERDELTVLIRSALKNYQDNYLKSLEKLESVERDLDHLKHAKVSLCLARDTLLKLTEQHHAIWADRLNEIANELLKQASLDYEMLQFDADMNIRVRRKGSRDPLSTWQMQNQVSQGSREQLSFIVHLAVSKFLSKRRPLPLILDEPFADVDDDRFVRNMRLLLKIAASGKQVIVFSCHQKRHQWLMEQLPADERSALELCQLVPLKAGAGNFAGRQLTT
jgi:uncharacterized protein YhaN